MEPRFLATSSPVLHYTLALRYRSDILHIPQCFPTSEPYESALWVAIKFFRDVHLFYSSASPWGRWMAVYREHRNTHSMLPYQPLPIPPVLPCGSSGTLAQCHILAPFALHCSQRASPSRSTSQDSSWVFESKASFLALPMSDLLGFHSEAIYSQCVLKVGFCFCMSLLPGILLL